MLGELSDNFRNIWKWTETLWKWLWTNFVNWKLSANSRTIFGIYSFLPQSKLFIKEDSAFCYCGSWNIPLYPICILLSVLLSVYYCGHSSCPAFLQSGWLIIEQDGARFNWWNNWNRIIGKIWRVIKTQENVFGETREKIFVRKMLGELSNNFRNMWKWLWTNFVNWNLSENSRTIFGIFSFFPYNKLFIKEDSAFCYFASWNIPLYPLCILLSVLL